MKKIIISLCSTGIVFLTLFSGCEKSLEKVEPELKRGRIAPAETATDADGNVYQTVVIGPQVWMAGNLKTTKYRDGSSIPYGSADANSPAYYWYNNDIANKQPFGALYNFYAVSSGRLAPKGWHIPSEKEWEALKQNSGGINNLVESGSLYWLVQNAGATNSTGFTGLPGGGKWSGFGQMGDEGIWWSSTTYGNLALGYHMYYWAPPGNGWELHRYDDDWYVSYSVRCVKDAVPTVVTSPVTNISPSTAASGGSIVLDGGYPINEQGVCWHTSRNPTVKKYKTTEVHEAGIDNFVSQLSGLKPNTTYYLRGYATSNKGTGYGNEISFTTATKY